MIGVEYIGAIVGIVDVAARLGLRLATFISEAKKAGDTQSKLYGKATRLHSVLVAVQVTSNKFEGYVRRNPVSDGARLISTLHSALDCCKTTVQNFERELGTLGPVTVDPSLSQKVQLQWRLDVKRPGIAKLEADIQANIETLQLLLHCMSLFLHEEALTAVHVGHERTQQSLMHLHQGSARTQQCLVEIIESIDRLSQIPQYQPQHTLRVRTSPLDLIGAQMASGPEEDPEIQVVRDSIGVARSLVDAISARGSVVDRSDSDGPTRPGSNSGLSHIGASNGGIEGMNAAQDAPIDQQSSPESKTAFEIARCNRSTPENLWAAQIAPLRDSPPQGGISSPEFKESFYDSELMTQLLEGYISTAKKDLVDQRYHDAQQNLTNAINQGQTREEIHKFPFDDKQQVEISLVEAYIGLEDFESAEAKLKTLLRSADDGSLMRTKIDYLVAKSHRDRYCRAKDAALLPHLELAAMRSYSKVLGYERANAENPAIAPSPFVNPSIKILIETYEWKNDKVAVDVIRGRHPSIPSTTFPRLPNGLPLRQHVGSVSNAADGGEQPPEALPLSTGPSLSTVPSQGRTGSMASGPTTAPTTISIPSPSTNLVSMIQEGNTNMVKSLIDHKVADIEQIDQASGLTPLLLAAKYKQTEVCGALLTNQPVKANIHAKGKDGRSVLHVALFGSGGEDMIQLLLEHSADPNAVDNDGKTPLHFCVEQNKVSAVRHLLSKNAEKEILSKANETALQLAIRKRKPRLVKILYNAGAVVDKANCSSMSQDIKWILQQPRAPNADSGLGPAVSRQNSAATEQTTRTTRSGLSWLHRSSS